MNFFSDFGYTAAEILNYHLFELDGRGVSVGKLFILGLSLSFGIWLARRISAWTSDKILRRAGLGEGERAAVQTIAFYALGAIATLITLDIAGIPLRALTIVGGAFAIGIGFGSQNIMNNFISGLILLMERPIRVGDTIQIDNFNGKVTTVGARSTRITTGDNIEVVIPNSKLLESNVQNFTLYDSSVRKNIDIPLPYSVDPEVLKPLFVQLANNHQAVQKYPVPVTTLLSFNENAIMMRLSFSINLKAPNNGNVESDLRCAVLQELRQRKIKIPTAQRLFRFVDPNLPENIASSPEKMPTNL